MSQAKRAEQITREAILELLSDEENARVSTAEGASKLPQGAEYVDLERLDRGVQHASSGSATMGHVLPRSAVSAATWGKILARLGK